MRRKYRRYTKEDLVDVVKTSKSYAECLKKLDLIVAGGNYKQLQRNIDKYGLDTSHMTHKASNQGLEFKSFDDLKCTNAIKKRIISERGCSCENCKLDTWLGLPISIELEHVDGNNRNNERSNLKLLCPNCHSQTSTWRRKKRNDGGT